MTFRRLWHLNLSMVLVGAVAASLWVGLAGGRDLLARLLRLHPAIIGAMLSVTAFWLLMRFLRWQFLLRAVGVRLPVRPSLTIYLASLAGSATPAYAGELVRGLFIKRHFGTPLRTTSAVLIVERLFDVAALALIAAATAGAAQPRSAPLALAAAALLLIVGLGMVRRLRVAPEVVAHLRDGRNLALALLFSLAIWLPAALMLSLAAAGMGLWLTPLDGMRVYSGATLLGGLTLMPAGVGATGSLAILDLQALGLALGEAVTVVSVMRLLSTGAVLALGAAFLTRELRLLRPAESGAAHHFDAIAQEYSAQFSEHVWNLLLARKLRLLTEALPGPPTAAGLGLDLGCGLGRQCLEMERRGYRVVGVDAAFGLLRQAEQAGAAVATGDALALPFADATFDFVYMVGVLHHLPDVATQRAACREVVRVLKPGGRFIIHETNPRNPLFRFYMGYIFPMLKSIDEGTEWWIEPQRWEAIEGAQLAALRYFTFLPDFVPERLLRPLLALERWLEASPLRGYAVHYVAVLQKRPSSAPMAARPAPTAATGRVAPA